MTFGRTDLLFFSDMGDEYQGFLCHSMIRNRAGLLETVTVTNIASQLMGMA